MTFNFKAIIEDYCGTGKLSEEEVDFLEREHIKTMNTISELLTPSIANLFPLSFTTVTVKVVVPVGALTPTTVFDSKIAWPI